MYVPRVEIPISNVRHVCVCVSVCVCVCVCVCVSLMMCRIACDGIKDISFSSGRNVFHNVEVSIAYNLAPYWRGGGPGGCGGRARLIDSKMALLYLLPG